MSKKLDTRGIAVLIIPVRKATFIVLTSLATSILEALPDILIMLVDAIPMLVINIVDAIMQSLPSILVAIVNLVAQIVANLPSVLLTILNQFYQLFYVNIPATIISAFVSIVSGICSYLNIK